MIDSLVWRSQKYDFIVKNKKATLPSTFVSRTTIARWDICGAFFNSERMQRKPRDRIWTLKRLMTIFFDNHHSPVSNSCVQYRKSRCVPEPFRKFVNALYKVQIPNHFCLQLSIVEAKGESCIFLQYLNDWKEPFWLNGSNSFHSKHSIFLQFF